MLGRFFLIALLLVGATAVALFATRTGYRVAELKDDAGVTCVYWLGIGLTESRHEIAEASELRRFECPLLLRGVSL